MSFDYALQFGNLPATVHNLSSGLVGDLTIAVWDRRDGSGLQVDLNAHPEVCSHSELVGHQERFLALLGGLTDTDPDAPLARLDLLTADERRPSWSPRPPRPPPSGHACRSCSRLGRRRPRTHPPRRWAAPSGRTPNSTPAPTGWRTS